jgi:hypothetical protein
MGRSSAGPYVEGKKRPASEGGPYRSACGTEGLVPLDPTSHESWRDPTARSKLIAPHRIAQGAPHGKRTQ